MGDKHACVRFYGDLAALAWNTDELGNAEVAFGVPRSVKDAVESKGVPHTEVDLVLVNGESVGFGRLLADGDRISVYPPFHRLDVEQLTQVRPPPLPQPRFVLDVHLGRLARRLRLLGFDCLYRNDYGDDELAHLARDDRCLLTRDRGLLMRRCVTHGYLLRSDEPTRQTVEVVYRFDLGDRLAPFRRCIRCNGNLLPVQKNAVQHRLEARTRAEHDDFRQCGSCRRLYWKGSHHASLSSFVGHVRHATRGGVASQPGADALAAARNPDYRPSGSSSC